MLRPCPACQRHINAEATHCLFCAVSLPPAPVRESRSVTGRISRAAVFAGAIAAAPLGCGEARPRYEMLPPPAGSASVVTTGQVKGRLRDHTGGSAVGLYVTLYGESLRHHAASTGLDSINSITGPDGAFAFVDIESGEYRVRAAGRAREAQVIVRAGQAVVIDFVLDKPPQRGHGHEARPYGAPPARRRVV